MRKGDKGKRVRGERAAEKWERANGEEGGGEWGSGREIEEGQ